MAAPIFKFTQRLGEEDVGNPLLKRALRYIKRVGAAEAGITTLETAIILIAFVVVASIFAFTMLSAGTFSTERSKEASYTSPTDGQSSMEVKGGVIAIASTTGPSGTVDSLVFTVANVPDGKAVNLATGDLAEVVFEYRDAQQRVTLDNSDWAVEFLGNYNENDLLEVGELAEVTVQLRDVISTPLTTSTTFVLEMKPASGAILSLQRTTPAWLDAVNDLR